MAGDNVDFQSGTLATPAAGTKVSSDEDVTNGQVQRMKIAVSADGSSTHVGADADGLQVQGGAADDAVAAGNPVQIGGLAKASDGTDPGSLAEGDIASLIADLNRRLYVNTAHPNFWSANDFSSSAQTNTQLIATPGVGLSLYVVSVVMSYANVGNIRLVENTGGPSTILGPYYFAANGGLAFRFDPPIKLTSNNNLGFTSSFADDHVVTVSGFTAP